MSNPGPAVSSIDVRLSIPAQEYLRLYQSGVANVSAVAVDGRRVQFPSRALRPFVTHQGVVGMFRLYLDEDNRLVNLVRV
ncbi:DUF2835 domain-containing protein [Marinibactrum halimedae]|uniref:DUF2835 family protein n=1 Tax=Marinibactrum halimedae TaxID=1444977 RepID=A0AA37T6D2_9GAMM|nr:DUF2835 domain-containing protein [Marinibactrum halimedae]MCD9458588.1 DUF2835 domain-containing protein [Marinibactrum halimedae]GLS26544.1 hypothetical protein GCM10007877_22600 [Marinibactrum halimedae]